MSLAYCPVCRGNKYIIGLGLMERACIECNETGYVKADEKPIDYDEPITNVNGHEVDAPIPIKRKPGRKPGCNKPKLEVKA